MGLKTYIRKIVKFILQSMNQKKVEVNVSTIQYGNLLHDRNIIVTGGGSGIGLAIAKKLSKEKANVIIIGRNESKLKEAKKILILNMLYTMLKTYMK